MLRGVWVCVCVRLGLDVYVFVLWSVWECVCLCFGLYVFKCCVYACVCFGVCVSVCVRTGYLSQDGVGQLVDDFVVALAPAQGGGARLHLQDGADQRQGLQPLRTTPTKQDDHTHNTG